MKGHLAYIRVSTHKQGEGVSLDEQRAAIEHYAERNDLKIAEWFEERVTAAKKGRPVFSAILKRLKKREADGLIIHKIDRSARNLRDWADLGDLIDAGVSVHFAHESYDLHSRGGRLSADIQAIIAADYIRNLKDEVMKGIRGRLKQGLYPFMAPIGYLNSGAGKTKAIDPVRAPVVERAFALYATGEYSTERLASELNKRGLQTQWKTPITPNTVSRILNNPFYAGVLYLPSTGESFAGAHTPLVSMKVFKKVQNLLARKDRPRTRRHNFFFRGLFRCARCHRLLLGEVQKGHLYYRCHTRGCSGGCFREDALDSAIRDFFSTLRFPPGWRERLKFVFKTIVDDEVKAASARKALHRARLERLKAQEAKLLDALLDGVIDKQKFEAKQRTLVEERMEAEGIGGHQAPIGATAYEKVEKLLELAETAQQCYEIAKPEKKRQMIVLLSSNRTAHGKEVLVEPSFLLSRAENIMAFLECAQSSCITPDDIEAVKDLLKWAETEGEALDDEPLTLPGISDARIQRSCWRRSLSKGGLDDCGSLPTEYI